MSPCRFLFRTACVIRLGLAAPAFALVDLVPDRIAEGTLSPSAVAVEAGGVRLALPFDSGPDRLFWDFRLRALPPHATAIAVDLTCLEPSAIRGISLHLRRDGNWISTAVAPEGPDRQTLVFQRSEFVPEGSGKAFWQEATDMRLSFWKGAPRSASVTIHAVRPMTHSVAILRGSERTAPGETSLASLCAARVRTLLDKAGIPAALLEDKIEPDDLQRYRLLVLPYNPRLPHEWLERLERFVHQGGRVMVFYQSNPRLGRLLGMDPRPYATQSEPWLTISFPAGTLPGLPPAMPHRTHHLLPVRAGAPDALTVGHWNTPDGIPNPRVPASAVSPRGLWFSHVPPLSGPSAVQWLFSTMAAMDSSYEPLRDQHLRQAEERDRKALRIVAETHPKIPEIRAAWMTARGGRVRSEQARALAADGITVLFEHLATGSHAHYRTGNPIPSSDLGRRRSANYVARNLASDRKLGLELHAWVICWNVSEFSEQHLNRLRQEGRLMLNAQGESVPWMCPSHPENRNAVLAVCRDLAVRGVAGIHLDYIRYPDQTVCFCPATRSEFEKSRVAPVGDWPQAVLPQGPLHAEFKRFLASEITGFVRTLASDLRSVAPEIRLSAAVFPTPEIASGKGQEWSAWMGEDGLDFICPMVYTASAERLAVMLDLNLDALPGNPARLVPGLGNSADESQLDALGVAQQIAELRKRGLGGFALFQADVDLVGRILPRLRLEDPSRKAP